MKVTLPIIRGASIIPGASCSAVTCYEPEQEEIPVNVAVRGTMSMPTAETVSEMRTLAIPCATNKLVTTPGVANTKLHDEMCHHMNRDQYIH